MYDNKIAMVLLDTLQNWQKLNAASFLASSIAIKFPETHGRPFVTASNVEYLPFLKHPVLIYKADESGAIRKAFQRAKERELQIGIFTQALFSTRNEEENLHEISKLQDEEHDLAGIVLYGPRKMVDKAVKDLKFHS